MSQRPGNPNPSKYLTANNASRTPFSAEVTKQIERLFVRKLARKHGGRWTIAEALGTVRS